MVFEQVAIICLFLCEDQFVLQCHLLFSSKQDGHKEAYQQHARVIGQLRQQTHGCWV